MKFAYISFLTLVSLVATKDVPSDFSKKPSEGRAFIPGNFGNPLPAGLDGFYPRNYYQGANLAPIFNTLLANGQYGINLNYGNQGFVNNVLGSVFGNSCNNGGILGSIFGNSGNSPHCYGGIISLQTTRPNVVNYFQTNNNQIGLNINGFGGNGLPGKGVIQIIGDKNSIIQDRAHQSYYLNPNSRYQLKYI